MSKSLVPRSLRAFAGLALAAGSLRPTAVSAQTAGQNVNMVSGREWPGGDPFLQRQNEPSLDVSTRNPSHLVAGANDYRTVDIPFDAALPGETNAGDAWLGLFKSLDGGRTWRSTLLPGYPQDQSADGLASPLKGFAAAADATVRAGASGVFLYSGIAFNRGTNAPGVLFVARFIDNNDKENGDAARGRDPIKYAGTVVVDTGNSGQFLDKPTLAFDVPRPGDTPCTFTTPKDGGGTLTQTVPGGRAYLAYTMFVGGTNNINTKLMVASTTDCGATWGQPVKVTSDSHINQGAALAIDPTTGALTVAWRRFAEGSDPNAIAVALSTDRGKTWTTPTLVQSLPSYNSASPAAPTFFDQGTTSSSMRTNAYPALASDGTGRLYLAWSQRGVGPGGDARIVLTTSTNGTAWSTPMPVDNGLVTDDEGVPFSVSGRGHQLMPALKFAAGKLMVLYYDLRLDHTIGIFIPVHPAPSTKGLFFTETRQTKGELEPPSANPGSVFTPFLTDSGLTLRRHTIDVRVAQADPGASPAFTSARVSRYVYGSRRGSLTIEQLQINPPNLPMFKQGTAPFLGDYIDIAGPPTFVPQAGGTWAWNTAPAKDAVFHAAWTDNRDVRPPTDGNWANYTPVGSTGGTSLYDPTQTKPPCVTGQAGMRNQNIYTAKILQGLVVTTPSNAKQLTTAFPRVFATIVQNTTEFQKSYRLTIANQPLPTGNASFIRDSVLPTIDVSLAPRSSASRPVFITSSNPKAAVTVRVEEIAAPAGALVTNGLTGSIVYNPDVSNPDVSNPDVSNPDVSNPDVSNVEVYTPDVSNPDVSNPDVSNPDVSNPDVSNPDVSNPDVSNPDVSNIGVATPDVSNPDVSNPDVSNPDVSNTVLSDASYRLTNNGNTAATYRVRLIGIPPASAKLQLILTKVYATPVLVGCTLAEQPQNTLVTNIVKPLIESTDTTTLADPGTTIPDVSNATMTLAPGETGLITLRGNTGIAQMQDIVSQIAPIVVAHAAPSGYSAPLFIKTSALPGGVVGQAYSSSVAAIGGKPPYAFSISAGALPTGVTMSGAGALTGALSGPAGTSTFTVTVTDASTPRRTATRTFSLTVNKAATTTIVASSANPSFFGQSVTFTATVAVTAPGAGSPSGTVTFSEGSTVLGTGTVSGGVATFATSAFSAAGHIITASYSGDASFAASTATTFNQSVNPAQTTTAVTSSANPSVFGQPVTLTATVTVTAPGAGSPTGTVTFSEGSTVLGTGTVSGGIATFTASTLSAVSHSIVATYGGEPNFAGSSTPTLTQLVNKASASMVVSSSPAAPVFGQAVTLTANVTAVAPGAGTPGGTVSFFDNGASVGVPVALSGGSASTSTTPATAGSHSFSATYNGDGNFAGGVTASGGLPTTVAPALTSTTLAPSPGPTVFGQSVTFTATVAVTAPGTGTPAGTVTFYDGATSLGTASPSGGVATFTTNALPVGSHSITAGYADTASFKGSTSASITQAVGKAASAANVSSSAPSSAYGQSVTLTATITAVSPGAGTPSGTVTFLDGAFVLGPGTLSNSGAAAIAVSLAPGAHSITATYGGDANFTASASAALVQVVGKPTPTATLTVNPAASVWGQPVGLSASVSTTAGLLPPTGSMTFKDGATVLGTVSFSSGAASLPTSALSVGTHSITATYSGDANYASSTSPAVILTVGKALTTTTVTASSNPSVFGQSTKFTATIAVTAPGAGSPAGTVTFFDGATALGTGAVSGGMATFTTSTLAIGTHAITASYGGDGNFTASSSGPVTENVYHAAYTFTGFQTPLAAAGTLSAPSYSGTGAYGNAQPVKWQLRDGSGANVTDLTSTTVIKAIAYINGACSGAPNGAETLLYSPTTGAKGGSTFRSGSTGFIFNWDTGVVPGPGCYTLVLQLNDGSAAKATTIKLQ